MNKFESEYEQQQQKQSSESAKAAIDKTVYKPL